MNAHADHVLKDGTPVGVSSGTIYSYFYREVLSHGAIDVDQARDRQRGRRASGATTAGASRTSAPRSSASPTSSEGRNDQVDTAALTAAAG